MMIPENTIQTIGDRYRFLLRPLALVVLLLAHTALFAKKLIVTSTPAEADVQIDGRYAGATPLTLEIHGTEIVGPGGLRWKSPITMVLAKSGCTPHRTQITHTFLDSKSSHVELDCYRSHLDAGFQFLLKERYRDSIREYELALGLDHNHFEGFFNLGLAYMGLAQYREARKAFDAAIRLKSDAPEALNMKGIACSKLLLHTEAISAFRNAIRLKADFPMAYVGLADEYRLSANHEDALDSVEHAIRIKPDLAEAYRVKARILEQLGRTNEALSAAQHAFDLKPDSAEANLTLGWEFDESGQVQIALEYAKRAVSLDPNLAVGYTNMCRAYDELGQYANAVMACQEALARRQPHAQTLVYLAVAYERLGQSNGASTAYQRAVARFRDEPETDEYAQFLWGNACFRLALVDQAVEHYQKAIRLRPDFKPAHLNLGIAYIRLKQYEKALDEYNVLRRTDGIRAQTLHRLLLDISTDNASLGQQERKVDTRLPATQLSAQADIRCNVDCTITIDHTQAQPLLAGQSQSFHVSPGKHTISATSADTHEHWRTTTILEKNSRTQIVVPITPKALRTGGETEKKVLLEEIAQVRANIDATQRQIAAVSGARTRLVITRDSLSERQRQARQKAETIVSQIQVYEAQIDPELKQAEHDDEAASRSCSQGSSASDTFSTLMKAADTTSCLMSKQSATNHRKRAQDFLEEINKLSHELYVLTKP